MASADWTDFTGVLNSSDLIRGVTAGEAPPIGGGTFTYGMRSLNVVTGVFAKFANQANFAPTAAFKDHSIRGAVKKGISAGNAGFSPFLCAVVQGSDVTFAGYVLGISAGDPGHITLCKRRLVEGIPDAAPGAQGVLRRSTTTVPVDTWKHLRLDCVINNNNDVVINAFENDVVANGVASPVWVAIPGLTQFVDDALGANSGSAPFTAGRMGFGGWVNDVGRRMYFDRIECIRET